jgi:hypothetical protein
MKLLRSASGFLFLVASACSASAPDPLQGDDHAQVGEADARGVAPVGRQTYRALRDLAPNVTLSMLGEDDGTSCTASFRIGPAADLSDREVLRLFGFNAEKQLASDSFTFEARDPRDQQFWQNFIETEDDAESAKKIAAILSGPDVVRVATMVVEDDKAFGAPVYLLAFMSDKSIVALRGYVGSMSF